MKPFSVEKRVTSRPRRCLASPGHSNPRIEIHEWHVSGEATWHLDAGLCDLARTDMGVGLASASTSVFSVTLELRLVSWLR